MRDKIKLVSSAGTGHFYTTTKNKRTMTGKFEIKKFDPTIRKHVNKFLKKPDVIGLFYARHKQHLLNTAFTYK